MISNIAFQTLRSSEYISCMGHANIKGYIHMTSYDHICTSSSPSSNCIPTQCCTTQQHTIHPTTPSDNSKWASLFVVQFSKSWGGSPPPSRGSSFPDPEPFLSSHSRLPLERSKWKFLHVWSLSPHPHAGIRGCIHKVFWFPCLCDSIVGALGMQLGILPKSFQEVVLIPEGYALPIGGWCRSSCIKSSRNPRVLSTETLARVENLLWSPAQGNTVCGQRRLFVLPVPQVFLHDGI